MKNLSARSSTGHIAALVSGALLPLGLAPFNFWGITLLSCALLYLLTETLPPRQLFRRCFWYGVGLFGSGVSWVYISINTHGGESVAISLFLTGLLLLLLALCFALPFSLFGRFPPSGLKRLALFPALWVVVEWIRGWIFTGFPWLYAGNAFIDTPLAGWAPITGVLGISLIAVFSAMALLQLFRRTLSPAARLLPFAVTLALWGGGHLLTTVSWTKPIEKPLTLAMVQPALTPSQKWNSQILYEILVQLRDLSSGHWHNDLMIWPESAIPTLREDVEPFIEYMEEIARESDTLLITGIPILEENRYFNGVILLGNGEGSYRKQHLVPFGEYIPLASLLRGIIGFFDRPMSSFSPGPANQPLLQAGTTAIATAICYEMVFQDLVSRSAKDAGMILTLSNDVWFGDSIAPHQHLQMVRMRAIENGKPVVRSTNDGISAIIDARGNISHRFPQFIAGTLEGEVVPHEGTTPFNRFGSWPVVVLCLALAALGLRVSRNTSQV